MSCPPPPGLVLRRRAAGALLLLGLAAAPRGLSALAAPGQGAGGGAGTVAPTGAPQDRNVLGGALRLCGTSPMTGFLRDGWCRSSGADRGAHLVAAVVDERFLAFSRSRGNDLVTPRGGFPGLVPGDRWCLCALRWLEAHEAGVAPRVDLEATHEQALRFVPLDALVANSIAAAAGAEDTGRDEL